VEGRYPCHDARREKVPGPLQDLGKLANSCFEIWFTKPDVLCLYAEKVLADWSTCHPQEAADKLASACTCDMRKLALDLCHFWRKQQKMNNKRVAKLQGIYYRATGGDWLQSRSLRPPLGFRRLMHARG